ncbi:MULTISPECIES: hypothetical protein [unclassified Microbacterium]|nr:MULTISPECIES: hypothetical protein [unclassified Microbacterium]
MTFVVVTLCVGVPMAVTGMGVIECLAASGATTGLLARAWIWLKTNP